MALMLKFAFAEAGLHRIQLEILPDHHASSKVAQKLGFRREGLAKGLMLKDGVWRDYDIWALTIEKWQNRQD